MSCWSCCNLVGSMSKRDYKVATIDGIELEPLGGEKIDMDSKNKTNHSTNPYLKDNKDGEKHTNGVTFGKLGRGGAPVKIAVVGGGQAGTKVWRRERIEMTHDPDLDDCAFLSGGESIVGHHTRNGVTVCSQKRALLVTAVVLGSLLLIAIIIAFAGPQTDCSCARKLKTGLEMDEENTTEPFNPIATNGEPFPWLNLTLPTTIRPLRYIVTIHPNLTTMDVKGQVTIELSIEKETNFILLHIQDLNVTEKAVVLMGSKGYALKIIKVLEYPPRQQFYIEVKDKLKRKLNYTLNLRWYSKLNAEPEGFYADQYEITNGVEKSLAATVFQPNGARRAFPCFDEPHIRAPFRISVFRDRFHIGLSNSIVHTTEDVGFYMGTGLLRDDFRDTPPLPADSISWVVSDFQRETLPPSAFYMQSSGSSTTSSAGKKSSHYGKSDQKKEKQPPVRNITALTHSLNINIMHRNASLTTTPTSPISPANKTITAISHPYGYTIRKAPSYTFYAPKELLPRARFILLTSRNVLEYLQNWLNVSYPLTKVDFVSLPSLDRDIISNLGLITLRATILLDPESITSKQHQQSALLVAEAMVRQFFGGITSSKMLKDLWLWEGLIKYLGIHILSTLRINWPLKEMYLLNMFSTALDIDAIQGWTSIINGTNINGINEEFYIEKTAATFSMLHKALGEDRFRNCLGSFLKLYNFKTAEPSDLWTTCSKKSSGFRNIKEMMSLWTQQSGFPLLVVTINNNSISISQKPFQPAEFLAIHDEAYDGNYNYKPSIENSNTSSTQGVVLSFTSSSTPSTTISISNTSDKILKPKKWIFPITYITDINNNTEIVWMQNTNVTFKVSEAVRWIKLNAQQSGYYRVLYDEKNWANIIEDLINKIEKFSPEDRIGLVSDAFALCHANILPCDITLNMLNYLTKETNWGPMTLALHHLERWRRILKYSECFLMLSEYIKMKLENIIEKLGWNDDGDETTRLMRPEILLASVLWENVDSVAKTKDLFNQFLFYNGSSIPPNLREVVYTGSILSGEYIYWQHCWERFVALQRTTESQVERMQLLRALGRTKDAWLQNRLLSHVTLLPTSEVVQVLQAIAGTPTGGAMACRFLQAKWFDLEHRVGHGTNDFAKIISAITQYGATKFEFDELKSLVYRFGKGPGRAILNMTLSSVAANVEWVARSQMSIFKWVENNLHAH